MKYMLDTSICVSLIRNNPECVLANLRANRRDGIAISTIVLAELEYGAEMSAFPEKNSRILNRFLLPITVLHFDDFAAVEYGLIRAALQKRGTPIGLMDMLIAAHAMSEGLTLVTNNIREFERVEGLAIANWVEP